jgi:membrane protein DedA with SNARE-associated domain/membrane-associated phospholipid phosphatase
MVNWILHLHGVLAYAIIFAVPALEASVFLGFIFPGEIAVLLGGVLAFQGRISLAGAIVAAIAGAVIGDSVGYEVGRHFGTRLLDGPLRRFVKHQHRERATMFLHRHRGKAVFLGRFTAALRVLVPGMAGIAQIPYPSFLLYNALGGICWAGGFTLLGYGAGNGYRRVAHVAGRASLILLGLIIAVALVAVAARWVARNPERVGAWWSRQRERPLLRRFGRQLDFLGRRLRPGEVFGLGLSLGLVAVALIGFGFGAVVQDVARREELVHFDAPVLHTLMRNSESGVTAFMKTVTTLGSSAFIAGAAVLAALIFALRRSWLKMTMIIAAPLGALTLERIVKIVVRRPRPPVHALVHATGFSFPSGHATVAAAFYGALALLAARATASWPRRVAVWTSVVVLVGLIGFSRMYLRVHYLSDVLGGLALGSMWVSVVVVTAGVWQRARVGGAAPSASPAREKLST